MNTRAAATLTLAALALAGCHVTHNANGDKNNVSIATPFGSMNVKTNTGGNADTGLTVYPGATPAKDEDDDNDKTSSANVNLNFGSFHLGVKTASYTTPDPSDKVIAFYKNDMAHFGDVIECRNNQPIGTPTRTSQGLACDDKDSHGNIHTGNTSGHKDEIELRAGSPTTQHIVGITPQNGGTHIGLALLNLPSGFSKDAE